MADGGPPLTLASLPSEMHAHIVGMLTKPRHLAAARCASRLLGGGDMVAVVSRRLPYYIYDLLRSGPLPLIVAVLNTSLSGVDFNGAITAAAHRGSMDLLRIVHAALEVRVGSCRSSLCPLRADGAAGVLSSLPYHSYWIRSKRSASRTYPLPGSPSPSGGCSPRATWTWRAT